MIPWHYMVCWMPLHSKSAEVSQRILSNGRASYLSFVGGTPLRTFTTTVRLAFFSRAIPSKIFVWQDETLAETKLLKEWFTVWLMCSTIGKKEMLWLTSKAIWPHISLSMHFMYKTLSIQTQ